MSFRREFETGVKGTLNSRMEERGFRPSVEVWPGDDDFAAWVSAHRDPARSIICATPEYRNAPFCGAGVH